MDSNSVIIYVEIEPASGHFHQVLLDRTLYQAILSMIGPLCRLGPDGRLQAPVHPRQCLQLAQYKPYHTLEEIGQLAKISNPH